MSVNVSWDAIEDGDPNLYYTLYLASFSDSCADCAVPDLPFAVFLDNITTSSVLLQLPVAQKFAVAVKAVSPINGASPPSALSVFHTGSMSCTLFLTLYTNNTQLFRLR